MIKKYPVCHERIRSIPKQFSWVDHRLVRDHHLERLTHPAAALYLFLVTVADRNGLSYYADQSLCRCLAMQEPVLINARDCLRSAGLIAYKSPLYQILDLNPDCHPKTTSRTGAGSSEPMTLKQIFQQIAGGQP